MGITIGQYTDTSDAEVPTLPPATEVDLLAHSGTVETTDIDGGVQAAEVKPAPAPATPAQVAQEVRAAAQEAPVAEPKVEAEENAIEALAEEVEAKEEAAEVKAESQVEEATSYVVAEDFDPDEFGVNEVKDYLAKTSPEEFDRVIEAERNGQGRKTILALAK